VRDLPFLGLDPFSPPPSHSQPTPVGVAAFVRAPVTGPFNPRPAASHHHRLHLPDPHFSCTASFSQCPWVPARIDRPHGTLPVALRSPSSSHRIPLLRGTNDAGPLALNPVNRRLYRVRVSHESLFLSPLTRPPSRCVEAPSSRATGPHTLPEPGALPSRALRSRPRRITIILHTILIQQNYRLRNLALRRRYGRR